MKQKRDKDIFLKAWRITAGCLTGLVILAVALKIIPGIFGYQSYTVLSGSMEPALPVGSVVYVNSNNKSPETGDIVTYLRSESVRVTHRVADVSEDGYILKGDANSSPDFNIVSQRQIIGVYAFHIPILGYILSAVQGRRAIVTLIILIVINIIPDIGDTINKKRGRRSGREDEEI